MVEDSRNSLNESITICKSHGFLTGYKNPFPVSLIKTLYELSLPNCFVKDCVDSVERPPPRNSKIPNNKNRI